MCEVPLRAHPSESGSSASGGPPINRKLTKLSDLRPDARNANAGTERGGQMIERSLRSYGAGRSILIDKHGNIIAGNKTVENAMNAGLEDVEIVQTDGKRIIAVQRVDLDLTTDKAAKELALADNRTNEVSLNWDSDNLRSMLDDGVDLRAFWTEKELDTLLAVEETMTAVSGQDHITETYSVLVDKLSEKQQAELLEKLDHEGYSCRALIS